VLVVPSVLAERKDDIKRIVTLFGNPFLRLNGEIGLNVYGNVTSYLAEGDIQPVGLKYSRTDCMTSRMLSRDCARARSAASTDRPSSRKYLIAMLNVSNSRSKFCLFEENNEYILSIIDQTEDTLFKDRFDF